MVLLLLGVRIESHAEPISYLWVATASGVFNGVKFSNATVSVGIYADTDDVNLTATGERQVTGEAIISIPSLGFAQYSIGKRVFANDSAIGVEGLFSINATNWAGYDLKTGWPRIIFAGSNVRASNVAQDTSVGSVTISAGVSRR
jgi:hypothetical protein